MLRTIDACGSPTGNVLFAGRNPAGGAIPQEYVQMRQRDVEDAKQQNETSMMTARQLLSILRLSQALARLHFSAKVTEEVRAARRAVAAIAWARHRTVCAPCAWGAIGWYAVCCVGHTGEDRRPAAAALLGL